MNILTYLITDGNTVDSYIGKGTFDPDSSAASGSHKTGYFDYLVAIFVVVGSIVIMSKLFGQPGNPRVETQQVQYIAPAPPSRTPATPDKYKIHMGDEITN